MVEEKFDIVVVGAGIFGMATAYHLQRNNPTKKILVLERLGQVGQANTALSAAAYRNMFTSETNQLLSDSSINFYLHIQNDLKQNIDMEQIGYLWLLTEELFTDPSVKNWLSNMEKNSIEYHVYGEQDLKQKNQALVQSLKGDEEAEMMKLENIKYGLFGPKCGVLSPTRLTEFYRDEYMKLSSTPPRFNLNVTGLLLEPTEKLDLPGEPYIWQDARVTGVKTEEGKIHADTTVIATGAWVNQLLDPVGIPSHIKAKKRQLFSVPAEGAEMKGLLNTKGFNSLGLSPFIILPKGVYVRPVRQENAFWVGCADKLNRAYKYLPTDDDLVGEDSYFEQSIYPILSKYLPPFLNIRPVNKWGGNYGYSFDNIPYVYESAGAIIVAGGSGSGVMKADALGRIADALYRGEKETLLYGGVPFPTHNLSVTKREIAVEDVII